MTFSLMTPRKFSGDLLILGRLMTDDDQNFQRLTYRRFFDDVEISEDLLTVASLMTSKFQKSVDRNFKNH